MKKAAIIVAAGSGTRMVSAVPKQFMLLNGKPLIMHTLQRFYEYDQKLLIILVLPASETGNWQTLVSKFAFPVPHTIVNGGASRFESVKKGLEKITWPCVVAIHDGVRPFCSIALIDRCFTEANINSNAVPSVIIPESVRKIDAKGGSKSVERESLRIIQTPQCFDSEKLKRAYQNNSSENFTDDAGVFEKDGNKIHLIEGEKHNIKITVAADLTLASAIEKVFMLRAKV